MTPRIRIVSGPLSAKDRAIPTRMQGKIGALVVFEGLVREGEDGRPLRALWYEAYEPMTTRCLENLAYELAAAHTQGQAQVLLVRIEHSIERVMVGGCSFRLTVGAAHRKEALAFMDEFIDRMKKEVPIWKSPIWPPSPGQSPVYA